MDKFDGMNVEIGGGRAQVTLMWPDGSRERYPSVLRNLPDLLQALRDDHSVRVVVLTGAGDKFLSTLGTDGPPRPPGPPENPYALIKKTGQLLEVLVAMEKPVIAMVNGDALAIGSSIAMLCDFVIANEDAHISDAHIALHHFVPHFPRESGFVPGDGGAIAWPSRMSLMKAKEYLMLGRPVKASELAAIGAINAAVPLEELEGTVDLLVSELVSRPAWALAWTKMLLNRQLRENLLSSFDLGFALQSLTMQAGQRDDGKGVLRL